MESTEHEHPARNSRGRKAACKRCRQSKLRCEYDDDLPCHRCKRLRLECKIDPNYKRVTTSNKMEDLENEVQNLRNLVNKEHNLLPQHLSPTYSNSPVSAGYRSDGRAAGSFPSSIGAGHTRNSQTISGTSHLSSPAAAASASTLESSTEFRSLGPIQLHRTEIVSLFSIYFEEYHSFLPILEPDIDPDQIFERSPLLFWSVILVASRQHRADATLISRLFTPLHDLMWTEISAKPFFINTILALLLTAYWPPPNLHFWTDTSMVLIHIAVSSAMHLGLHHFGREYDVRGPILQPKPSSPTEIVRTWLGCVIVSQSYSTILGQPPIVSLTSWSVNHACQPNNPYRLPTELHHSLMIQRCSYRASKLLSENDDDQSGLPAESQLFSVVSNCEQEFDALQASLEGQLSYTNALRLQASKLYAQNIYFLGPAENPEQRAGVMRCYATAKSIISGLVSDERSPDVLSRSPVLAFMQIFCATGVLSVVLNSSYGRGLDYDSGKLLFNAATLLMRQVNTLHHEKQEKQLASRVADRMKMYWNLAEFDSMLRSSKPILKVQTRQGASVIFDAVVKMRDLVAKNNLSSAYYESASWNKAPSQPAQHGNRSPPALQPQPSSATELHPPATAQGFEGMSYPTWQSSDEVTRNVIGPGPSHPYDQLEAWESYDVDWLSMFTNSIPFDVV